MSNPRRSKPASTPDLGFASSKGLSVPSETQLPTVVYVHGIGNKPAPAILKVQWDRALFGTDMGARTRMSYWADLRYPQPLPPALGEAIQATALDVHAERPFASTVDILRELAPQGPEAATFARRMLARVEEHNRRTASGTHAEAYNARVLPSFLQRPVTEWLTRNFIKDCAAYFYDADQKRAIQQRLREILIPQPQPYIVIAHSLGSVIAYDVLRTLDGALELALLLTIGSPLGIAEVQQNIVKPLRFPGATRKWENFFDRLDPVALEQELHGDFPGSSGGKVVDSPVVNRDTLSLTGFNPHSGTGYLQTQEVRHAVRAVVGSAYAAPISGFVVARDVAAAIADPSVRHPVLVELTNDGAAHPMGVSVDTLAARREMVARALVRIVRGSRAKKRSRVGSENRSDEDILASVDFDPLQRYIAASLTPSEVYQLSALCPQLPIQNIWSNSAKSALLNVSLHTTQAYTAQLGYRARGVGITWAVLDTGVRGDHPHFARHGNIAAVWDCTQRGSPTPVAPSASSDPNGHGTHVCGIICGSDVAGPPVYQGMAPETRLHVYKVLRDDGTGNDAWIIKALDHISGLNEGSPSLVIHGVNMSLGGPFDPTVFGCGYSPICRELQRLWRQGIVVCVAAGNEGRIAVETLEGEVDVNLDLSIGDPANLEDCIAVGSVHREFPHMYGISYFSSRGPTADGRSKPDLVAPGEQIVSANTQFIPDDPATNYIPLSGTSMACPHVSGIAAAFLSVRREFIGHPDQLKEILLQNCTDLRRDRYHQGAGMPNLVKMLMVT